MRGREGEGGRGREGENGGGVGKNLEIRKRKRISMGRQKRRG